MSRWGFVLGAAAAGAACDVGSAALTDRLRTCAELDDTGKRLACYDSLSGRPNDQPTATAVSESAPAPTKLPPPAAPGAPTRGGWQISESRSAIDDSRNLVAILRSNEDYETRLTKTTAGLVLRCSENRTDAYINWNTYLGLESISVLTRIDSGRAVTTTWGLSTDNEATSSRNAIGFIKQLLGKETLLARVTPYGESPVTVTFTLAGVEQAVATLQEACGWS